MVAAEELCVWADGRSVGRHSCFDVVRTSDPEGSRWRMDDFLDEGDRRIGSRKGLFQRQGVDEPKDGDAGKDRSPQ